MLNCCTRLFHGGCQQKWHNGIIANKVYNSSPTESGFAYLYIHYHINLGGGAAHFIFLWFDASHRAADGLISTALPVDSWQWDWNCTILLAFNDVTHTHTHAHQPTQCCSVKAVRSHAKRKRKIKRLWINTFTMTCWKTFAANQKKTKKKLFNLNSSHIQSVKCFALKCWCFVFFPH